MVFFGGERGKCYESWDSVAGAACAMVVARNQLIFLISGAGKECAPGVRETPRSPEIKKLTDAAPGPAPRHQKRPRVRGLF